MKNVIKIAITKGKPMSSKSTRRRALKDKPSPTTLKASELTLVQAREFLEKKLDEFDGSSKDEIIAELNWAAEKALEDLEFATKEIEYFMEREKEKQK